MNDFDLAYDPFGVMMPPQPAKQTQLKCGTRGSALALAQTQLVIDLLKKKHPEVTVEIIPIRTEGDADTTTPLSDKGGKGLFVTAIEEALRNGEIDFAVHSAKDLPTELPEDMILAAVPERGNRADVLLMDAAADYPREDYTGFRIGTSSARRTLLAEDRFPGCSVTFLRGNLNTRIDKLRAGEYDAILIAAAGLDRLQPDLQGLRRVELDPTDFVPAAGQGILVCEAKRRTEAVRILHSIDHPGTHALLDAERKLLSLLEADCHAAVGVCADYLESGDFCISAVYNTPTVYQVEPDMAHLNEALRELATFLAKPH